MCVRVRKTNTKHAYHTATDREIVSAIQTDVRLDGGTYNSQTKLAQLSVRTCTSLKRTEIEASVVTDELQRIYQLSPTQRFCRGHFHNVERQGQCKEQRSTGRRHPLDLQAETHMEENVINKCTQAHMSEVMTQRNCLKKNPR